jgi:uncharacterized protein (TIGR02145 family)
MRWNFEIKILAIFIILIGLAATIAYGENVCGDANSDANVNVSDAVFIINYVFLGSAAPDPLCSGDANNDGAVNVSDAVFIINYVFVGGDAPEPNCCCPSVIDYDGNVYETVQIGDQCWMMENLKVTHYRNGDPIPSVKDGSVWASLTSGAWCNYNNNGGYVEEYGRLYNFYAVNDSRKIAPVGWHVPTDAEWKEMEIYLGMTQQDADATGWRGKGQGGKMKEVGTIHWDAPNIGATNESGFTALPGGCRSMYGDFINMGGFAYFWCATMNGPAQAYCRSLYSGSADIARYYNYDELGYSVRCVKDQ